ncbi:major facilitator superfamily domain-containing protein [Aspergillus californicus]
MAVSEESPLLTPSNDTHRCEARPRTKGSDIFVIFVTFLGVFMASADESLVISTYTTIASQFHHLKDGSWLLLAYNLGYCVSLPVYSVFSDAYGRRNILVGSYLLFAFSCVACGASSTITQLILSRVVTGSSGAGIAVVVSLILADLLPTRDIALYRGYQNTVNTVGRSMGAPIGGILADTIGWRWSFFGQVPLILLCTFLSLHLLPSALNNTEVQDDCGRTDEEGEAVLPSKRSPIRDLDVAGLFAFAATVLTLLFLLRAVGAQNETMFRQISLLALLFVSGCSIFLTIELYWARKPLIPVRLFTQSIGAWFGVETFVLGGRFAVSTSTQLMVTTLKFSQLVSNLVPYFIRAEHATDFVASLSHVVLRPVISQILNEVRFADTLPSRMQQMVRMSYLDSFQSIPIIAFVSTAVVFPVLALLKEPVIP